MQDEHPERPRVFCLSMQRSGTTSVGDWLEAHGFRRAGWPLSFRMGWTRAWMNDDYEAIFSCPEFLQRDAFEDDPWWCPGFHRVLAARFPEAKFVLLTRDPGLWFQSLCHHSGGLNPGQTDIHARIFGRTSELEAMIASRPDLDPTAFNLLSITEHADHYQAVYRRHVADVRSSFATMPQQLFTGELDSPSTFDELCRFLGVARNPAVPIPHANRRTPEMARRLRDHLDARKAPQCG
jgi:hypothetical protein